ncbi:MauE/DoxX family redox-associated membrane protein [Brevibacillus daliensis]|uniref:MauE/DoxX family redox-associated membrane protein n=1 Tax=Brevibacillus daliensis TaxID=2892995 RepID=UPI001E359786|nr:MauE/DoxX family redox-associated membrane protein [Brevibacillus daliensis]
MNISLLFNLLILNIFVSSGISKIINLKEFLNTTSLFMSTKNKVIMLSISFSIIISEISLGICLLFPKYNIISTTSLIILLLIFNIMVIKKLLKREKIKCNCGGFLGNEIISMKIPARNLLLMLILSINFFIPYFNDLSFTNILFSQIIVLLALISYQLIYRTKNVLNEITNN